MVPGGCIFTTSIAIPFVKLVGMVWFYVSVHRRSTRHLVAKTRLYRVIDELGRWSTMDVFTVAVYMPLVQFGQLATVRVGGGLPALLAVVVLTMLASRFFDPRCCGTRRFLIRRPSGHPRMRGSMSDKPLRRPRNTMAGGRDGSGRCRSPRLAW